MTWFPPQHPFPPEAPKRRDDPDRWRHDPGKRGRMSLSMTQVVVGLILLAVGSSVVAFCVGLSDTNGAEIAIVSPEDGSTHPPGDIVVRVRAVGDQQVGRFEDPRGPGDDDGHIGDWELSYRPTSDSQEWVQIAEGSGFVSSRSGNGLYLLDLQDPGTYEVRFVVDNGERTEPVVKTVRFRVADDAETASP